MEDNEVLSIGSVVKLRNSKGLVMVISFGMIANKNGKENSIYDYLGCPYPHGVITTDYFIYFDKSDIEEIIFKGYSDDADKECKKGYLELRKVYEDMSEK